ncbi:MAG: TetR/AcrR family transcriptional regulator [Rhizomicrobium sp.]
MRPGRRRNARDTRAAILVSARRAFTRFGYDGVGVREIAEGAGVTAMLVNRYFGSKERLFADVVAATMAEPGILTDRVTKQRQDVASLGADIAAELMAKTAPGDTPLDGFLIMLRSASNERAAAIWREQIERHYQKTLTDMLPGAMAPERAALLLALVSGFQMMRQVIGVPALAQANAAALSKLLARICQAVIDAEAG